MKHKYIQIKVCLYCQCGIKLYFPWYTHTHKPHTQSLYQLKILLFHTWTENQPHLWHPGVTMSALSLPLTITSPAHNLCHPAVHGWVWPRNVISIRFDFTFHVCPKIFGNDINLSQSWMLISRILKAQQAKSTPEHIQNTWNANIHSK